MKYTAEANSCISTLAYYWALGGMPLTSTEIWYRQLNSACTTTTFSLADIRTTLSRLTEQGVAREEQGFFSLTSYPAQEWEQRPQRIAHSIQKWHILAQKASLLPYIPYVRHLRVLGSVAVGNAQEGSDLDISIGVSPQRLWLCRGGITALTHILKKRRWGSHTQDRLCFNHYTAKSNASYGICDPFFTQVDNQALLLWSSTEGEYHVRPSRFGLALKRIAEYMGNSSGAAFALEYLLGRLQIRKIATSAIPYPSKLPAPSSSSEHLVFYYPKIEEVRKTLAEVLSSYDLRTS